MDFFGIGVPLGRWFKIEVILHFTFVLYVAYGLMHGMHVLFMALLFATVLLHEFGHALSCKALGGLAPRIILWPLGGIAFVQPPMNPTAWLITTVCGPLVNAILWPTCWALSTYWLDPYFAHTATPTPIMVTIDQVCDAMWTINKGLLLFNLIPAYPMDGGRILQEVLWYIVGYGRSLMIAGMIGVVAGGGFVILGMGITEIQIGSLPLGKVNHTDTNLIVIGILCAMQSMAIYRQAQLIGTWRKN